MIPGRTASVSDIDPLRLYLVVKPFITRRNASVLQTLRFIPEKPGIGFQQNPSPEDKSQVSGRRSNLFLF